MSIRTRLGCWLPAAAVLSLVLLSLLALYLRSGSPETPTVVPSQPATAPPVAATRPAISRSTPRAPIAAIGPRRDDIVQAVSVAAARTAVLQAGGTVTGELAIIRAVGAALDDGELARLRDAQVP